MKKIAVVMSLVALISGVASMAYAGLDDFLKNVNIEARTDLKNFSVKLSTQFNVPLPQVEAVIKSTAEPADAFMVLQLGQMADKQPEVVLQTYQRGKGRGWGELAKELGIKPGSPAFHALKNGNLSFTGRPGGEDNEKGKGKGKGRK